MTQHIKLYALGFFTVMTGLLAVAINSDLFRNMFSADKDSDPGLACDCTINCAYTVTSNASFTLPADSDKAELVELDTIEKLANDFTRAEGKVRLVSLLSPTCPYCVAGFRAVGNILERNDDPDLQVYIVWEPMLHSDNRKEAEKIATQLSDDRVIQYWDKGKLTGKAWQEALGIGGPAWDVYMLYNPGAEWKIKPGNPDYWMHQLGGVTQAPRLDEQKLEEELQKLLNSDS